MSTDVLDRFAAARAVADAVLYEGYVLYPYRASSRKNQLRWQFGVLAPKAFSEADGSERWALRTECLVERGSVPALAVRIRCLQVQHRGVEAAAPALSASGESQFTPVDTFEVDGTVYVGWDEAVDQIVDLAPLPLSTLDGHGYTQDFQFPGGADIELVHHRDGPLAGRVVRRRHPIDGRVRVETSHPDGGGPIVKVSVTVENTTQWAGPSAKRDAVMAHSLIAVHTMLAIDDGTFVSLLDPPPEAEEAAAGCHNDGTFPVLVGGDEVMLSSPIILYDQPEIAPESPGDLYDSTEIDEILALRVLTLTEEEKSEARATDPRAAAIIDRCDDMPPEMWERLHGAVRSLYPTPMAEDPPATENMSTDPVPWWDPDVDAEVDPWTDSVLIGGVEVTKGTGVVLRPSRRSDAQDLFLRGLAATVAGVFKDVDGSVQVAVTIDDDPASAEFVWQGRYLFFHPDEVEPLAGPEGSR